MVAVDIGGSHISSIEVIDITTGRVNGSLNVQHVDMSSDSGLEILDAWSSNMRKTIQAATSFDGNIAIAFPGPFDYEQGIVHNHQNGKFYALQGMDIKMELMKRIPECNAIHFENDAACFGLGEYDYSSNRPGNKMIALTLGTGIGCSFIDSGNVIRIGDSVPEGGEVYYLPFLKGIADEYFSTRWFVGKAKEYGYTVSGVKELIKRADKISLRMIFDEFISNFSEFFLPLSMQFNTDIIRIGGNIARAWDYFGNSIELLFREHQIEVSKSELGELAICLGAARSFLLKQNR
jgi:glucokinase